MFLQALGIHSCVRASYSFWYVLYTVVCVYAAVPWLPRTGSLPSTIHFSVCAIMMAQKTVHRKPRYQTFARGGGSDTETSSLVLATLWHSLAVVTWGGLVRRCLQWHTWMLGGVASDFLYSCREAFWTQETLPRLPDVNFSVIPLSMISISTALICSLPLLYTSYPPSWWQILG